MENTEEFLSKIKELSGEDINECYQCGKCSAGCPIAVNMSILPHMIIRRLQLGQVGKVLEEEAIWKCASCMTCGSRCPRKVNLCNIIEALRTLWKQKYKDKYKLEDLSEDGLKELPQQALVSAFRKFTY